MSLMLVVKLNIVLDLENSNGLKLFLLEFDLQIHEIKLTDLIVLASRDMNRSKTVNCHLNP